MNEKRRRIIEEARTWLGTPFKHQGRTKGRGCDCVGLLVESAKDIPGFRFKDDISYGHQPHTSTILNQTSKYLEKITLAEAQPGDIVLLYFERDPTHFGILTDKGIIHAYAMGKREVVEHGFSKDWENRIVSVFKIPGVD